MPKKSFKPMSKSTLRVAVIALIALIGAAIIFTGNNPKKTDANSASPEQTVLHRFAKPQSSLVFVENRGQWHDRAQFVARTKGMTAWFEQDAITLRLEKRQAQKQSRPAVVRLAFEGASEGVRIEGENRQRGTRSFFVGNDRSKWQRQVPGYGQILYRGIYAGIDVRVREANGLLEYDLLLQPGADLSQVVIRCEGIEKLQIEPDGSLALQTGVGPVRQNLPLTWYELPSGARETVECHYRLLDNTSFSFFVPDLNPALALVIDPAVEWRTLLGGSDVENVGIPNGLVVADNGDILLTGTTSSLDFPLTLGAYDTTYAGNTDVFVARFNPDLSGSDQLLWSTFVGGSGLDEAHAVEIDNSGNIILAGSTRSDDFPITSDAYDTTHNGLTDGFFARLDASGNNLLYSTVIGGLQDDSILDVALDFLQNITITGGTSSTDFPVTPSAFDTRLQTQEDAFVARLDLNQTNETQLVWSTFLGGENRVSTAKHLAIDPSGMVIVYGETNSQNFPTTPDAFNTSPGRSDLFLARFDLNQTGQAQLNYSTFFGGRQGDETGNAMAVDDAGVVTLAGWTRADDFPVTAGAYDTTRNGGFPFDAFVSQLDLNQSGAAQLIYSTFIGGTAEDGSNGVAVDALGRILVAGFTESSDFPSTVNAFDRSYNSLGDGFLIRLNPRQVGSAQLEYATFLGGTNLDDALLLKLDNSGNPVIGGITHSQNFPTSPGAYDETANGKQDVFLVRLAIGEPQNTPPRVIGTIPDQVIISFGDPFVVDLDSIFIDAETSTLLYSAASLNLPTALTGISGSILTVTPRDVGFATITVRANDGAGGEASIQFEVEVVLSFRPVISHQPVLSGQVGQAIAIEADISDDEGALAGATLNYRIGGDLSFEITEMDVSPSPVDTIIFHVSGLIPDIAVTNKGVEYFISTVDNHGVEARLPLSGVFSVRVRVDSTGITKSSAQPSGSEQTGYRIISLPLDADNQSPETVLADNLGPYDPAKWRLYQWAALATGGVAKVEFPAVADMAPGIGFWLIVKDADQVIDTGAGTTVSTSKSFRIPLSVGWNLVGNPFNFGAVAEDTLSDGSGFSMFAYEDGVYSGQLNTTTTELRPFAGYAVLSGSTSELLIKPSPPANGSTLAKQIGTFHDIEALWSIRIRAQCQNARDENTIAAVVQGASPQWDEGDHPEPPGIGEYVSVYFPHPEWQQLSTRFSRDARPEPLEGAAWEFAVETNIRDVVNLTFDGIENVPAEYDVRLIDKELKTTTDLRLTPTYPVAARSPENAKRLTLAIGKSDYFDKEFPALSQIPEDFILAQNFPNPFNPSTTIQYALPHRGKITLKVYNLLGQEVKTLVNDELRDAGYHGAVWEGRNTDGEAVASGVYLIRMQAEDFLQTRKMLLVQ